MSGRDEVEVLYTDNSRELKAIEQLGYSIEYVDSSKSFVEREIRHLFGGSTCEPCSVRVPAVDVAFCHSAKMQLQPVKTL